MSRHGFSPYLAAGVGGASESQEATKLLIRYFQFYHLFMILSTMQLYLVNNPLTVPIVPTRLPLVGKHHFPNSSHPPPPPSWRCSKSVLQSVLAHHNYLCHSPSNRCQRCGGHTTCVATAKMRPRDTYGREGSRTITIWPLGDRTRTHRSKEVAVPAGLTVVPFNPAMAWRN